uniref:Uncharacterized protein n=1 Tax=Rhizophora mucronata TaxID=61149 RepID=A0A2P2NYJ5_RHIMU
MTQKQSMNRRDEFKVNSSSDTRFVQKN